MWRIFHHPYVLVFTWDILYFLCFVSLFGLFCQHNNIPHSLCTRLCSRVIGFYNLLRLRVPQFHLRGPREYARPRRTRTFFLEDILRWRRRRLPRPSPSTRWLATGRSLNTGSRTWDFKFRTKRWWSPTLESLTLMSWTRISSYINHIIIAGP